jgi:hypothetical protein
MENEEEKMKNLLKNSIKNYENKEYKESIETSEKILDIGDHNKLLNGEILSNAYTIIGKSYNKLEKYKESIEHLEEAIKLNKENNEAKELIFEINDYLENTYYAMKIKKKTVYLKNGDKYVGDYENCKYDGFGKMFYKNGDRFEGEFKENQKNGFGIYYYKNGDYFKGNFVNDNKSGKNFKLIKRRRIF